MNRIRTSLLLCVLLALGFAQMAPAQGIPSEGKDYYLGYLHPSFNNVVPAQTAGFFRVYALVSSFQNNTITVSYFDPVTKKEDYGANYTISARQTTQVPLDLTRMKMKDPGEIAGEFRSCHITAKRPVNVQFFSTGANSGGSYLALPVNAWGKNYVVASYNDNPGYGAMVGGRGPSEYDLAAGYFMVIAAYDGTEVDITPTALTGGNHIGVNQGAGSDGTPKPYRVGLNRGQCWLVKSASAKKEQEDDISGSIVKSNKPVAVIAGHEDASPGDGDVGGRNLEARDFMLEQMIPVEYWDHTGHITIPMMDSPGTTAQGGLGENQRLYVYDENVPGTVNFVKGTSAPLPLNPGTYSAPIEMNNTVFPSHFYSDDSSSKFMIMQYDLRNHGSGTPFPSPSMMSIIPRGLWRNAYLWYVPTNVDERLQAYYVTVIATKDGVERYHEPMDTILKRNWWTDSLRVATNGGTLGRITKLGAAKQNWNNIPGHPDLKASTFQVSPGTSYYMSAPFPFMVYHFGDRGVDYDRDLGDFDNDDNFFTYALPLGTALQKNVPRRMRITVDTLCSGWRVCAFDSNNPGGIKSVVLLDDPFGDIIPGGNYQYKNARFDPVDDPQNLKQITPVIPPQELCFNVLVENPGQDAYAPIHILDVNGKGYIVQLRFKKAAVEFIPTDSVGLVFDVFNAQMNRMGPPFIGQEVCKEYIFINKQESPRSFLLKKVEIPQPSQFTIKSVVPDVGTTIDPGDTVRITACFIGPDTMLYLDSIIFETDCFPTLLPLSGHPGTPLIIAEDKDFGTILIGTQFCRDVEVKNVGSLPFTLDSTWVLNNFGEFTFPTTHSKNKLPLTLLPGQSHLFRFCYSPNGEGTDTARMDWGQDIPDPYGDDIKSYSDLTGKGIMPGVNWDRPQQKFVVTCDADTVHRVNLVNTGTASAELTRIWFSGPDAAEFSIVATEYNTNPPTYGGTVIDTGLKMWVDIRFTPNLASPNPYRTRFATIHTSAKLDSGQIRDLALEATVLHATPAITTNVPSNDSLTYMYVQVGDLVCRRLTITNTGDAPLVIESYVAPGRPFVSIVPDLTPLLPFTIDTGVTVSFDICGTMDTWGDTTVPLILNYKDGLCTPATPIPLRFKSTKKDIVLDIPPYPPTYIDCRDNEVDAIFGNRGAGINITLHKVEIVNGAAPNNNANEFVFSANNTQLLDFGAGKVLAPDETETFKVRYNPVTVGNAGAYLRATYDSVGVIFIDSVPIIGQGVLLQNTFSVENPTAGQPYTAETGAFFTVPARITQPIAGPPGAAPAGARGATFTVTWLGDLFEFLKNNIDDMEINGFDASVVSGPTRDALGNESVVIHVESTTGDITNAIDLIELRFQLMITTDVQSDITISDGFFTDINRAPICYFVNQHIPTQFVPIDLCGDNVVREFLRGNKPTSISYLTPNPVIGGTDLKLGYRVNVSLTPITIEVYNVLGDKVRVLQSDKASAKGDHIATVATEGLTAGTYTIRLSGADWTETTSFVIEK